MIRLLKFTLLAGLTATINCRSNKTPSVVLLRSSLLPVPSASAIEFKNNKLFVFGDDATVLYIFDPDYHLIDTIRYRPETSVRLSKELKPDIESAFISGNDDDPVVTGVGSMSGNNRWQTIEYRIKDNTIKSAAPLFPKFTRFSAVKEINIEGSCLVQDKLLFCNRANTVTKKNHLLLLSKNQEVQVKEIVLKSDGILPGMSGLYYMKEQDLLLFTASEEDTPNAVQDGVIGESYLGWIKNFSKRMNGQIFVPDGFLKLSDFNSAFQEQKIESVCAETVSDTEFILHLVADNDKKESRIFKVLFRF